MIREEDFPHDALHLGLLVASKKSRTRSALFCVLLVRF